MAKPEIYTGFDPDNIRNYFTKRGWIVEKDVSIDCVNLARITKGAALECGDGRFDYLERRQAHGVRILGGVNAIMATLTGGNAVGLQRATELLKRFNVTPGTHSADEGGCGFADLWIAGKLDSAIYPYELNGIDRGGLKIGSWLTHRMKSLGGKHFRLNGNHKERGVKLNPFRGFTEEGGDGSSFRIDDWFMAGLGIPDEVRFFKIAETVEKLKPDAKKLEIIVP